MEQHGITANTTKRMVIDAGALYRNYGETSAELIGATRGGAVFTVERDDREIEIDGLRGPVKGLKRTVRQTARLEVTLIEPSEQTFLDLTRGTVVSDGTHRLITPDNTIALADYYMNVALIAEVMNTTDPIILTLLNGLSAQEWTFTTDDQDEGMIALVYEAHYDAASLTVVPYTIEIPVAAS